MRIAVREFKKLRRLLQRKRSNEIELCVKCFVILWWSRCTKIGEAHFPLLGTNGFHVKAKNERSTAAGSRLSSAP